MIYVYDCHYAPVGPEAGKSNHLSQYLEVSEDKKLPVGGVAL